MHRDTQIGLAMAIVLIGFAAALCFPREGQVRGPAADLPDAAAIDAAIAGASVKLYAEPGPSSERQQPAPSGPHEASAVPVAAAAAASPSPEAPPEPTLSAVGGTDPNPTVAVAAPSMPAPAVPVGAAGEIPDAKPTSCPEAVAVHVVKSGDTLSGLAQKYLGSVARYPEIFEANRDVLESPDDLRLGLRIRIPQR